MVGLIVAAARNYGAGKWTRKALVDAIVEATHLTHVRVERIVAASDGEKR